MMNQPPCQQHVAMRHREFQAAPSATFRLDRLAQSHTCSAAGQRCPCSAEFGSLTEYSASIEYYLCQCSVRGQSNYAWLRVTLWYPCSSSPSAISNQDWAHSAWRTSCFQSLLPQRLPSITFLTWPQHDCWRCSNSTSCDATDSWPREDCWPMPVFDCRCLVLIRKNCYRSLIWDMRLLLTILDIS